MELYLDIDGVILDFEAAFMNFIRRKYWPEMPPGFTPKTWEMDSEFGTKVDIGKAWDKFTMSKDFKRLDLLIDKESFNQVAQKHPVHLITNLPYRLFDSREANLKHHGLTYQELHLGGHFDFGIKNYPSKSQIIKDLLQQESELVFLDDHPSNCQDILEAFPQARVYLMERPHNLDKEDQGWTRVKDWNQFLERAGLLVGA